MKLIAPALIFCGAAAFGQSPQVPHKMQFAGLTLTIRDDARREIQKDVDALTLHPKYFNIKVERARTYFPIIEKIFAEERLPDDFKYLSLQESALVPDAVSSSNAVGFWQFKDFTAQEMGLRVDAEIDERMNIASASRGAARYLKQCNHYFNNWIYACQAYQMGAGGVMRSIGDKDLGVRHMEITTDTYWYVKKFLAHKIAFENAVGGKAQIDVTHVYTAGGRTLQEISKETSVDEQRLRDFNKWLKTERIPTDKEYDLVIPSGNGSAEFGVLAMTTSNTKSPAELTTASTGIAEEKVEVNGIPAIRARKGETLAVLAARANIGLSQFLHFNEIEIDQPTKPGQLYFMQKKKKHAMEDLYTTKPGEDLWMISQRFGVQQKYLVKYNDLEKDGKLTPGVTLFLSNRKPSVQESDAIEVAILDEDDSFDWDQPISKKTKAGLTKTSNQQIEEKDSDQPAATNTAPGTGIHEVKASDTLYSVARQYGVTIKELMEWNEKKDLSLSVGEKLRVRSR